MKSILFIILLFTLVSCQEAVLSPEKSVKDEPEIEIPPVHPNLRYPFGIGTYWVYNVYPFSYDSTGMNLASYIADSIIEEVVAIDSIFYKNQKVASYSIVVNSLSDIRRQFLKKMFWINDTLYENIDYLRPILIYPLKVGKKWKTSFFDNYGEVIYNENSSVVKLENIGVESKKIYNSFLIRYITNDRNGLYIGEETTYFHKDIGYLQSIDYSMFHQNYFGYRAATRLKRYEIK